MNTAPIQSYTTGMFIQVVITSFGYLHGDPPSADITLDARPIARDPHTSPEMRELTGLEPQVVASVLSHPDVNPFLRGVRSVIDVYVWARTQPPGTVTRVAIGCAGGRHRSVVLANQLMRWLISDGVGCDVEHRDILRPVVNR
jgi:RNase adaptor protein for sRNA GlmZ degradation